MSKISLEELEAALGKGEYSGWDVVRAAGQGATFGWGDELEGMVRSWFGDKTMREEIDLAREKIARFRDNHPMKAYGAEIAGGAITGGYGAAKAAGSAAARNAPRMFSIPGIGAMEGAIYGAGEAPAVGNIPGHAAASAALGAGGGYVTNKAAGLARAGLDRVSGKGYQRPIREAVDASGGPVAVGQVMDENPGHFVADASPELRSLAANVARQRGGRDVAHEAVEARQRRMPQDIQREAQRMGSDDFYGRMDEIIAQRKADAHRLYNETAYKIPVDPSKIPDTLLLDEDMVELVNQTVKVYNRKTGKGLKLPKFDEDNALTWLNTVKQIDDLQFWDEWQKAARGKVDSIAASGDRYLAGSVSEDLRRPVLDILDKQTDGAFKAARDTFAASKRLETALEDGRKVFKPSQDPEEVIRHASRMSDDERAAFLTGALREMRKLVGGAPDTANTAWKLVKSPDFRAKIEAVVGDPAKSRQFIGAMERLVEQNKTFNMVSQTRNSVTSDMANQTQATARSMANAGADLLQGNVVDAARGVGQAFRQQPSLSPDQAARSAGLLFGGDPAALMRMYRPGVMSPFIVPGLLGAQMPVFSGAAGKVSHYGQ